MKGSYGVSAAAAKKYELVKIGRYKAPPRHPANHPVRFRRVITGRGASTATSVYDS
jgi:hypothetical protein